tara:strand:+ start:2454 stop:2678 length:225 start_codon:yes stop_codon:yes gene_type:complete
MKEASTKIKSANLEDLYAAHRTLNTTDFREYVRNMIKNARAPNFKILREIDSQSKDQLLFSVTNFAFKGMGMGV